MQSLRMQPRALGRSRAAVSAIPSLRSTRPAVARRAVPVDVETEKTANPMNLVFVAAEVAPWSKTGGLGDVVGGLPIELAKRGHYVLTIAPRYDQYADGWDTSVVIEVDGEPVRFFHAVKKGVHRVFIDHPWFLAKVWGKTGARLYGSRSGADYLDNHKRFSLFCKAAIEAVRALPFGPGEDVTFVANDWHSALLPVLIKDVYQPRGEFKDAKVALCIHNIAFQGRFWPETFQDLGLPDSSLARLAFTDGYDRVFNEAEPLDEEEEARPPAAGTFPKLNWLKAGILASDKVVTVSPNYASEISAGPDTGVELDNVIRSVGGAEGIVNGMDLEEWDPARDKFLTVPYDETNVLEGKAAAKAQLQAELGLPVDPNVPLFGYIGRLEEQKGVDILLQAIPKAAAAGGIQVAVLGTGKAKFEAAVKALNKLPGVAGVVKFSAPLAHLITAGADYIVVPSRFEPCGLIQLHAMHYGTVPLVSATGGLVDTVKEGVTGFIMGRMDLDDLVAEDAEAVATTIGRAADAYRSGKWSSMVEASINQDLSWAKPAVKWEAVLEELKAGVVPQAPSKKDAVVTPVQETAPARKPANSLARAAAAPVAAAAAAPVVPPAPVGRPGAVVPPPASVAPATPAAAPTYKPVATPVTPAARPAAAAAAPVSKPAAPTNGAAKPAAAATPSTDGAAAAAKPAAAPAAAAPTAASATTDGAATTSAPTPKAKVSARSSRS